MKNFQTEIFSLGRWGIFTKAILVSCILANICFIPINKVNAQDFEWLHILEQRSISNNIDIYDNGDILLTGIDRASTAGFLARLTQHGEIIWKTLVHPFEYIGRFTAAYLNANQSKIYYFGNDGRYLVLDSLGSDTLSKGSLQVGDYDRLTISSIKERNDKYLISGQAQKNSTSSMFHVIFDPNESKVQYLRLIEDLFTFDYHVDVDSAGNIIEIIGKNSCIFMSLFDTNRLLVWSDTLCNTKIQSTNVTIGNRQHFYISGAVRDSFATNDFTGYLGRFSTIDGVNIWNSYFPNQVDGDYSMLNLVVEQDDHVLCSGSIGVIPRGPITDLQYSMIDDNGVIIWYRRKHIKGEGDYPTSLSITKDKSSILAGTSNVSDGSGREHSFIAKITLDSVAATKMNTNENPVIYPNPVDEILNLNMNNPHEYHDYFIYATNGQLEQKGKMISSVIDIAKLRDGLHLICIQNATSTQCIQFIKQ